MMTRKVEIKFNISTTTKTSFASPLDISIDSWNSASTAQAPAHHSHLGFRKSCRFCPAIFFSCSLFLFQKNLALQPFSPSLKPEFYLGLRNLALQPFSSSLKPESICPAPHPGDKVADHPHHPEKCSSSRKSGRNSGSPNMWIKRYCQKGFYL